MKSAIAMLVLAGVMVGAIQANESVRTPSVGQIVTYTPAVVGTVGELTQRAPSVIELAPVVIYASAPRKAVKQTAQCGAFNYRALEQGRGSVRGFCGAL